MFKRKLFKSFNNDESDGSAVQAKFMQTRIKMVEKHFPELKKAIFDYANKMAKSRDCVDHIAEALENYAKAENLTTAFRLQIREFANILLDVGTKQDIQVHAMETKVLEQLSQHDKLCRNVQTELERSVTANDKEKTCIRHLQRLRKSQFQNPVQISLAEAEVLKAQGESSRCRENLEEQIDIFERKRLNAVKETLLAWTLAELFYHSKALELFTGAYRIAADIDVNANIEEFRNKLLSGANIPQSVSSQRTESVFQLLSLPFRRSAKSTESGTVQPLCVQSSRSSTS